MNRLNALCALGLVSLSSAWFQQEPGPPDFGRDLGVPVTGVEPVDNRVGEEAAARIAGLTRYEVDDLRGMPVFRGDLTVRGRTQKALLLSMPLDLPGDGPRLVVALTERGEYITAGVWGDADFDEDPDRRWGAFLFVLGRFDYTSTKKRQATVEEYEEALAALPDPDAEAARFLIDQRRAMQRNSHFFRIHTLLKESGGFMRPDWASPMADEMSSLAERAKLLEPLFGDAATAAYRRLAEGTAGYFSGYSRIDAGSTREEVEAIERELMPGDMCQQCHTTVTESGDHFMNAVGGDLEPLLLPSVFRVGLDLAPAPGDDGRRSQAIVDALRASLYLARESSEGR